MPRSRHRVIIDTNLWISFLLTRSLSKLDPLFQEDHFRILFSQDLLDEFVEVAGRAKFRKYFPDTDLHDLLLKIRFKAEFIVVTSSVDLCRDPKDNFLLALAKDGNATHLITGDKDLLVLKTVEETQILTITEYLAMEGSGNE